MSDIPEGYFVNGVELLDFRREPIVIFPGEVVKKKRKKSKSMGDKRVALLARDGNSCHYCDQSMGLPLNNGKHYPAEITVEHVVPRSNGGSNLMFNLVLACYKCNNEFGSLYLKCECEFCELARRLYRASLV